MDKAADLIRLMLAGVFLLAFALSVVPASANACPNTRLVSGTAPLSRDVASLETVAAATPITAALNAHRHGHHGSTPDCCALGLCGSPAAAVLPAAGLVSPVSKSAPCFAPQHAAPIPGLNTSPTSPPPRSRT